MGRLGSTSPLYARYGWWRGWWCHGIILSLPLSREIVEDRSRSTLLLSKTWRRADPSRHFFVKKDGPGTEAGSGPERPGLPVPVCKCPCTPTTTSSHHYRSISSHTYSEFWVVPGFWSYLHVADLAGSKRTSGRHSICHGSVPVGHNRFCWHKVQTPIFQVANLCQ